MHADGSRPQHVSVLPITPSGRLANRPAITTPPPFADALRKLVASRPPKYAPPSLASRASHSPARPTLPERRRIVIEGGLLRGAGQCCRADRPDPATNPHNLFGSHMDDLTRAARAHTYLVRLAGRKEERHLLLVTTEGRLRDEILRSSVTLTSARIEIKVTYLEGPLLRETRGRMPVTEFIGEIDAEPGSGTDEW